MHVLNVSFYIIGIFIISRCREYPSSHGATLATFVGTGRSSSSGSGGGASNLSAKPKWMLIGQEGGSIVRCQISSVLGGSALNKVNILYLD